MDTDLLMVALHSHSSEYQRVKTKFLETSGAYSRRLSISEVFSLSMSVSQCNILRYLVCLLQDKSMDCIKLARYFIYRSVTI